MHSSHDTDLLSYKSQLRIKESEGEQRVYDPVRTKWYLLQPEELVRQLILIHLIEEMGYPPKLIGVEKQIIINQQKKRFDIVIFDKSAEPYILVETKSPTHTINQSTALQIAHYNTHLKAKYLWLSNGHENLYYEMNYKQESIKQITSLPNYQ